MSNDFCSRALVQVSYSIGVSEPLSIFVDSYGTVREGFTDYGNVLNLYNFRFKKYYIEKF